MPTCAYDHRDGSGGGVMAWSPKGTRFALAVDTRELAMASGRVSDPDLRPWETLGVGAAVPFDWSF